MQWQAHLGGSLVAKMSLALSILSASAKMALLTNAHVAVQRASMCWFSRMCPAATSRSLRAWATTFTIEALIIAYTILGVPYYNYSIMGSTTLF